MKSRLVKTVAVTLFASCQAIDFNPHLHIGSGGRTPNDFRRHASEIRIQDKLEEKYPAYYLSTPVDHFDESSSNHSGFFENKYWFDAQHYQPGGPVIVLLGGETDGRDRIPYLERGILAKLAAATSGIGVILEHRFYGESFPTPDLSIESLKLLTTDQALADTAYFANNIRFPGLERFGDLTAAAVPYFAYGGSYAGAHAAFLRLDYPDVFWGAIASSAAVYNYWEYYSPVAEYGPKACIAAQRLFVDMVDNILIKKNDSKLTSKLQLAFALPNITHVADFANQLGNGMAQWQGLNWDPEVSNDGIHAFCAKISSHKLLYPGLTGQRGTARELLAEGGYPHANDTIVTQLLNYMGWVEEEIAAPCAARGETQDYCFTTYNTTFYQQDDLGQYVWRSWAYQYCDQWGYLQTGGGNPPEIMPVVSRLVDVPYTSMVCRDAFNITRPSDVELTNRYGGYEVSAPRLAFIDGEWDPWRPMTPHGYMQGAPRRKSTTDEPFILIDRGLHHYDQNGVFENQTTPEFPPEAVAAAQKAEVEFVRAWLDEWHRQKKGLIVQNDWEMEL